MLDKVLLLKSWATVFHAETKAMQYADMTDIWFMLYKEVLYNDLHWNI